MLTPLLLIPSKVDSYVPPKILGLPSNEAKPLRCITFVILAKVSYLVKMVSLPSASLLSSYFLAWLA
jgi:hypothetical protein